MDTQEELATANQTAQQAEAVKQAEAAKQAEVLHKLIEMVVRQTQYDYEEAKQQLNDNKWDYMKVIRDEMGIQKKIEGANLTLNQEIYKQIRTKMDVAGNTIY